MQTRFQIQNLLALIALITINALSNSLPLNGKTPGQLSDALPNLFVPAGLTFAIWGVIYLFLLGWGAVQIAAFFSKKIMKNIAPSLEKVDNWFFLSCFFNICWLFAWHWQFIEISILMMIGLLASLIFLNKTAARTAFPAENWFEKWLQRPAFQLYQGWITVAFIANMTAFFVSKNWSGGGISPEIWATAMILVGGSLAAFLVWTRGQIFHGVAVIWAFLGIFIKRNALNDADLVKNTALFALVGLIILIVYKQKNGFDRSIETV
jgi:hypothetical protein